MPSYMCVCKYVLYIYVCMYVYIYIYIYLPLSLSIYIYIYTRITDLSSAVAGPAQCFFSSTLLAAIFITRWLLLFMIHLLILLFTLNVCSFFSHLGKSRRRRGRGRGFAAHRDLSAGRSVGRHGPLLGECALDALSA